MKFFFTIFLIMSTIYLNAQTYYRMNDTNNGQTINFTCPITDTRFADDGVNATHYSNAADRTITFCAPAGKLLKFDFGCGSNLTTERIHSSDTLFIYNGNSTSSPLSQVITGNPSNSNRLSYFGETSSFTFLTTSECVTFRFKSSASDNEDGWDACITCIDPISCGSNQPASDLFGGAPYICNLNGYCGTTSGDFGSDYPVNLNRVGGSCPSTLNFLGTIQNNSWLKFVASATNVVFDFNVTGCTNGIQTAIFSYNGTTLTRLSSCALSDGGHLGNFQLAAAGLTIGQTYYIMTDGNTGDVCNYTIRVNTGVATVDAGPNQTNCSGSPVTLTASGPPGAIYTWNSLDNVVNNQVGQTIIVNPSTSTTYVVEVSGGGICQNQRDSVQVLFCVALPIQLTNFSAQYKNSKVYLTWETSSQTNNSLFTIERSRNGTEWEVVQSIDGAGNSHTLLSYLLFDNKPYRGISYYRLKQTDYNGRFEYSNIRSVNINSLKSETLHIYPNPTLNTVVIEGDEEELSKFKIFSSNGQDITEKINVINKTKYKKSVDLSNLPNGVYYLNTKTITNKLYKQ